MRGAVWRAPRLVRVEDDLAVPSLVRPDDVIVRVTRTAICGTDLHPYRGDLPGFPPGTVLGHEVVGTIHAAGPSVTRLAVGQRVVVSDIVACGRCPSCRRGWHYQCDQATLFGYGDVVGRPLPGGQAEYLRVPHAEVVCGPVPDILEDDAALLMSDVLATAHAAAARAMIDDGAVVAVVGGGPVGLLAAGCARAMGAGAAVVVDPRPPRRSLAERLGFLGAEPGPAAAGVVGDLSAGRGADVTIEAVGTGAALHSALELTRPHGVVVSVGAPHGPAAPFPAIGAFSKELTIRFAVGDPISARGELLEWLQTGRIDPTAVISHRLPLAEAAAGYELFDRGEASKVVLVP